MNAIETKTLTKRYRDKLALDGLDLCVGQGELFALLGVNGAGKSTAIKLLSCLIAPTAGEAWLMGHSILREKERVKAVISLSPQETAVAPNLTVRENLELMAGIGGCSRGEVRAKASQSIREGGFAQVERKQARTLSGGWQRRLSIALALITDPQVLFLDEPTLGLDVLSRRELWREIQRLKGRVTVVLTTHYLEEAQALSDRIGILAEGRLRTVGTAGELMAQAGASSFEDAFVALAGERGAAL